MPARLPSESARQFTAGPPLGTSQPLSPAYAEAVRLRRERKTAVFEHLLDARNGFGLCEEEKDGGIILDGESQIHAGTSLQEKA